MDWQYLLSLDVQEAILTGLLVTIHISFYAGVGSLVVGTILGISQTSHTRWVASAAQGYVTFFRNIPVLVQLFFWYFGLPMILPPGDFPFLYGGNFGTNIAIWGLTLTWSAFVAEVVRGGIQAIPRAQFESAFATGLTRFQTFRYVIIRQVIPIITPGMTNEMINVVKSSAFAMVIAVPELTWQAQQMESETFKGFEAITAVTITYLLLSLSLSFISRIIDKIARIPGH